MRESPDPKEVLDANPQHAKELEHQRRKVRCGPVWDKGSQRWQLVVEIDIETTLEDVQESWQYIRVMREMLHNVQGPSLGHSRFLWQGWAYHLSHLRGGGLKPKQIAENINDGVDRLAEQAKENGLEFRYPEGYPFDNVYVSQMAKNWSALLNRYRENNG